MNKDQILSLIGSCDSTSFEVPEWEATVWIKHLSVIERLSISDDESGGIGYAVKLLSTCITNEQGESVFTVEELSAMPGEQTTVLLNLLDECKRVNGIGSDGADNDLGEV